MATQYHMHKWWFFFLWMHMHLVLCLKTICFFLSGDECSSDSRQTKAKIILGKEDCSAQWANAWGGEPHEEQLSDTVSSKPNIRGRSPLLTMQCLCKVVKFVRVECECSYSTISLYCKYFCCKMNVQDIRYLTLKLQGLTLI